MIGTYTSFDEDQDFAWNAVPLYLFLYGVENQLDQPLVVWPELRRLLQDAARENYLAEICKSESCATARRAHWRDMLASNFIRDIYLFQAKTTLQQDLKLMAYLNSRPNSNHYNGITNNCADFAADVLNFYFPGSARPDHLNDFGMTSPKAISKSFTHYARRHPALGLHVLRFSQLPGRFTPSHDVRKGTESAFRSKKWLLPMLFHWHELVLFTASYALTGRFNPERELRRYPGNESDILSDYAASHPAQTQPTLQMAALDYAGLFSTVEPASYLGTGEEWKLYRDRLSELIDEAVKKQLITERKSLQRLMKECGTRQHIFLDPSGGAWLEVVEDGVVRRVGISARNINAPGSDPEMAYVIMLARAEEMLQRSSKNRESLQQFRRDWQLLLEARHRLWPAPTSAGCGTCDQIPFGQRATQLNAK